MPTRMKYRAAHTRRSVWDETWTDWHIRARARCHRARVERKKPQWINGRLTAKRRKAARF